MSAVENLTTIDYTTLIIGIFAVLVGVKEGWEVISYFKTKLRIKMGFQEDKDILKDRIATLEKHDNWQYNQITKISKGIEGIQEQLLTNTIEDMRWEILDFASSLSAGRKFSKEQFEHVISTHERYVVVLQEHKMTNGLVTSSMEVINERYKYCLQHGFE